MTGHRATRDATTKIEVATASADVTTRGVVTTGLRRRHAVKAEDATASADVTTRGVATTGLRATAKADATTASMDVTMRSEVATASVDVTTRGVVTTGLRATAKAEATTASDDVTMRGVVTTDLLLTLAVKAAAATASEVAPTRGVVTTGLLPRPAVKAEDAIVDLAKRAATMDRGMTISGILRRLQWLVAERKRCPGYIATGASLRLCPSHRERLILGRVQYSSNAARRNWSSRKRVSGFTMARDEYR